MHFTTIFYLAVWGGMFTDVEMLREPQLYKNTMSLFNGFRALLPHLILYLCLLWIFVAKLKWPKFLTPMGFLFYYGITGILISFLSQAMVKSLFWGFFFLSPVLVVWIAYSGNHAMDNLRKIIAANYFASIMIFGGVIFELVRTGKWGRMGLQYYDLPLGVGTMIANGMGRFALIVCIVGAVRFIYSRARLRFLYLTLAIPGGYILMQTQSRTSLLGLAIASALLMIILGARWQFFLFGPAAAYIIWLSGYERRAQQSMDKLFGLTGRETTWNEAIELIKQSPIFGWGFHSDKIMMDGAHIHNSYIHAMIQSGIIGLLLFVAALLSVWFFIIQRGVLTRVHRAEKADRPYLVESILILGFLTGRSLFESTAAFFGIDLLILVPAIGFVYCWAKTHNPVESRSSQTS